MSLVRDPAPLTLVVPDAIKEKLAVCKNILFAKIIDDDGKNQN